MQIFRSSYRNSGLLYSLCAPYFFLLCNLSWRCFHNSGLQNARDMGSIPEVGRSLEEEMATCSSILAWEITWTEEPGGLQSTGSQRVGHDWAHTHAHTYLFYSVVLVSAVQQCEPAIRRHITPPSWASFLPTPPSRHPTPLGCHRAASWVSCVMQQLPTS